MPAGRTPGARCAGQTQISLTTNYGKLALEATLTHAGLSRAEVLNPGGTAWPQAGRRRCRAQKVGARACVAITVPDFASAERLVAASETIVSMPSLIATHYAGAYSLYHFPTPLKLPSLDIAMASDRDRWPIQGWPGSQSKSKRTQTIWVQPDP